VYLAAEGLGSDDSRICPLDGRKQSDLSALPNDVKLCVGGAPWNAQVGAKSSAAKPLKGFGGAGVVEVVADGDGNTFRTVDTVPFARGRICPSRVPEEASARNCHGESELDLIAARLARAKEDYAQRLRNRSST
jgi:hypothetical protein